MRAHLMPEISITKSRPPPPTHALCQTHEQLYTRGHAFCLSMWAMDGRATKRSPARARARCNNRNDFAVKINRVRERRHVVWRFVCTRDAVRRCRCRRCCVVLQTVPPLVSVRIYAFLASMQNVFNIIRNELELERGMVKKLILMT